MQNQKGTPLPLNDLMQAENAEVDLVAAAGVCRRLAVTSTHPEHQGPVDPITRGESARSTRQPMARARSEHAPPAQMDSEHSEHPRWPDSEHP